MGHLPKAKVPRTSQPKRAVSALQARTATIEVAESRFRSRFGPGSRTPVPFAQWSFKSLGAGLALPFALTNSGRFLLRRTAHRADASFVCPVSLHFVRSVRFAIVVCLLCRSADSFAHQASASLHLPPAALRLRPSPMHIVHWRAQGFDFP